MASDMPLEYPMLPREFITSLPDTELLLNLSDIRRLFVSEGESYSERKVEFLADQVSLISTELRQRSNNEDEKSVAQDEPTSMFLDSDDDDDYTTQDSKNHNGLAHQGMTHVSAALMSSSNPNRLDKKQHDDDQHEELRRLSITARLEDEIAQRLKAQQDEYELSLQRRTTKPKLSVSKEQEDMALQRDTYSATDVNAAQLWQQSRKIGHKRPTKHKNRLHANRSTKSISQKLWAQRRQVTTPSDEKFNPTKMLRKQTERDLIVKEAREAAEKRRLKRIAETTKRMRPQTAKLTRKPRPARKLAAVEPVAAQQSLPARPSSAVLSSPDKLRRSNMQQQQEKRKNMEQNAVKSSSSSSSSPKHTKALEATSSVQATGLEMPSASALVLKESESSVENADIEQESVTVSSSIAHSQQDAWKSLIGLSESDHHPDGEDAKSESSMKENMPSSSSSPSRNNELNDNNNDVSSSSSSDEIVAVIERRRHVQTRSSASDTGSSHDEMQADEVNRDEERNTYQFYVDRMEENKKLDQLQQEPARAQTEEEEEEAGPTKPDILECVTAVNPVHTGIRDLQASYQETFSPPLSVESPVVVESSSSHLRATSPPAVSRAANVEDVPVAIPIRAHIIGGGGGPPITTFACDSDTATTEDENPHKGATQSSKMLEELGPRRVSDDFYEKMSAKVNSRMARLGGEFDTSESDDLDDKYTQQAPSNYVDKAVLTDNESLNRYARIFRSVHLMFAVLWDNPVLAIPLQALLAQLHIAESYNSIVARKRRERAAPVTVTPPSLAFTSFRPQQYVKQPLPTTTTSSSVLPWPPVSNSKKRPEGNELIFLVTDEKDEVWSLVREAFVKINEDLTRVNNTSTQQQQQQQQLWHEYLDKPLLRSYPNQPAVWNLLWTWRQPRIDFSVLLAWQKVNHFPDARQLCRKDLLKKHVEHYSRQKGFQYANKFNVMPRTFVLPKEHLSFIETFTRAALKLRDRNYWIVKPISSSRGRGIRVINTVEAIDHNEHVIVQKYLPSPLLLDGYKFDLRLYVLVTSVQPLEAFIYTKGFARLSTVPFSLDPRHMKDKYVHLTNSSVNKTNLGEQEDDSVATTAADDDDDDDDDRRSYSRRRPRDPIEGGSKLSLATLQVKLAKLGVSWPQLWASITRVVIKTLSVVESKIDSHVCSFEVFGFDVLIDDKLRPWVLEVNASPDMACDTPLDLTVKPQLIKDTLRLVDPMPYNRSQLHAALQKMLKEGHFGNNRAEHSRNKASPDSVSNWSALQRILEGKVPRMYGQRPRVMGDYQVIAPSAMHDKIIAMRNAAVSGSPQSLEYRYRNAFPIIV